MTLERITQPPLFAAKTGSLPFFFDDFQIQLNRIDGAIFEDFFARKPVSGSVSVQRQLA